VTRLRPLNEPRPISVWTDDDGRPRTVAAGGSRTPVATVRETWRIDDEWWRRPIHRVYHLVVLEGGTQLTVYRDLAEGRWFAQG